jgi:putative resolvase
MSDGTWVRSWKAAEHFAVHPSTLRRWADTGRIEYRRTAGNQRVYNISGQVTNDPVSKKVSYVYVRVSSQKQRDDLDRQAKFLQDQFPDFTVIKDIGSGLNFKRRGLLKLLELSRQGLVQQVVVASKDRLCRFGFDLLQWQFNQDNVKLVVLDKSDKSPEREFSEDILAVLQVFACRWKGKRTYRIKNKKDQVTVNITTEETSGSVETRK